MKLYSVIPALILLVVTASTGAPAIAGAPAYVEDRISSWFGYERRDLEIDGHAAIIVSPRVVAEGSPWIWRTEFFGHEPQADISLLSNGFHVVWLDVQNLYGAPKALDRMDVFYDHLTSKRGLSMRVVLEGFSRGGLFSLNWAQRHPDRVACIYNDAPVCDFRSWPGGKGKGPGSAGDWQRCLEAYGLSEDDAIKWPHQTIDNLRPLAEAGIPLLHVCGDADEVVPFDENTRLLEQRYRQLNGPITIISKPGVQHHPHSLRFPQPIVQFVRNHVAGKPMLAVLCESPAEHQVFQRDAENHANIAVTGWVAVPGESLEFQVTSATTEKHNSTSGTDWITVESDSTTGRFETSVRIPAGSYQFKFRRSQGDGPITVVPRVGVGEVFVVAGQSNSTNYGSERQSTETGLVSTFDGTSWYPCTDPQPGTADDSTGGSFLPAFGDALVRRLGVPVGVSSTGAGATSVRQWLPPGVTFRNRTTIDAWIRATGEGEWEASGELFSRLTSRLQALGPNGCRAVLWHQGESDAGQARSGYPIEFQITGAQYEAFLTTLIRSSQDHAGWPVPWITAVSTYHSEADAADEEFRDAQRAVSEKGISIAGPDTDTLRKEFRDGVHFNGAGQRKHGELWAGAVMNWLPVP
ncbi:MAG: prolyl oligopeptidase family serine peptidase [Planctomyces sp.]|nr:prolyl oligopeptidase family serine peptidase [Planctomyces sp.]